MTQDAWQTRGWIRILLWMQGLTGVGVQLESGARIAAFLMSCRERSRVRARTATAFAATDWGAAFEEILDDGACPDRVRSINHTWRRLLARAQEEGSDFCLLLEDDLDFNLHLKCNLSRWLPLVRAWADRPFFGSLYNPQRSYLLRDAAEQFIVAEPWGFWGTQAIVLSRVTVSYVLRAWDESLAADLMLARAAARVAPLYQHIPSLVQHTGDVSTWGGIQHVALDFDRHFRAAERPRAAQPLAHAW